MSVDRHALCSAQVHSLDIFGHPVGGLVTHQAHGWVDSNDTDHTAGNWKQRLLKSSSVGWTTTAENYTLCIEKQLLYVYPVCFEKQSVRIEITAHFYNKVTTNKQINTVS